MSRFTAHGDLAGLHPVYYNPDAPSRGFASVPETLLSDPQIDAVTLAASIMWPGINPLVEDYSCFQNVRQLPAGSAATILGNKISFQSQYPREDSEVTFTETAEQIGEALKQVVKREVGASDGVSTDFSGGLDSTTVGLAAANECTSAAAVLGLVQYSETYPAGDIPYARRFAGLSTRLILREIVTELDELPFFHMPPAEISPSEPYRGTAIFGRERQRMIMARPRHITGVGGDALFDPDPTSVLVDLLLCGEDALASRLALYTGRAILKNPAEILEHARIKAHSTLAESLERVAWQLANNDCSASRDWLPSLGTAYGWLTPAIREQIAARAADVAARMPDTHFGMAATRQAILDSGDAHRHLQMLAKQHGIELAAPYLDETVLRSVLSLPSTMRIQPGQYKPLLHAASNAAGLAPEDIFRRKSKGTYPTEMRAGFRRVLPDIKAMLGKSRLVRLGIIDSEAVAESLVQPRPPISSFTQLLASENWLAYLGIDGPKANRSPSKKQPSAELVFPDQHFSLPSALHIIAGPGGQFAAFDSERGVFLPPVGTSTTTRLILQSLADNGSPRAAVVLLRQRYPTIAAERIRADVSSTIQGLTKHGWLWPVAVTAVRSRQLPEATTMQPPPAEAGEIKRVRESTLTAEDCTESEKNRY